MGSLPVVIRIAEGVNLLLTQLFYLLPLWLRFVLCSVVSFCVVVCGQVALALLGVLWKAGWL